MILAASLICSCGPRNNSTPTSEPVAEEPQKTVDVAAEARQAIEQIYAKVLDAYNNHVPESTLKKLKFDKRFLTASFLTDMLIIDSMDNQYPGEVGFHESDHWICGQDWNNVSMHVDSVCKVTDEEAEVWLTLTNMNNNTHQKLKVVQEKGQWKIDDFIVIRQDGMFSERKQMREYMGGI